MSRALVLPTACLLLAGLLMVEMPVDGMEVVMNDLQLTTTTLPTAYDFTLGNGVTERSGSDVMGWHGGLRLGYRHDLGGPDRAVAPVLGIEVARTAGELADGSIGSTEIGIAPGVAWGATDRTALLLVFAAIVGRTQVDLPDAPGARAAAVSGSSTAFAVRLEGQYLLNRHWGIGGELAWQRRQEHLTGDADLTLASQGWSLGIMVLWRLNFVPHRLE